MTSHPMEDFPHLEQINESIRTLFVRLTPSVLREFAVDFDPWPPDCPIFEDPIISTQHLARRVATHYKLKLSTVVVTFRSNLPVPGRVELSSALDYFVELNATHQGSPPIIAAILSHEVAHIFLHNAGIEFPKKLDDEILTDTTAAFLGLGATILNAATQNTTQLVNVITRETRHFGYITPAEFGYVIARRSAFFGHNSSPEMNKGLPQVSLREGLNRFKWESEQRPFVFPSIFRKIWTRLRRHDPLQKKTAFSCPYCSQGLRVASLSKMLLVHCSTCGNKIRCWT